MNEQYLRTAMVLGEEAIDALGRSRVLVAGLGGVGSYAVEALARAGVAGLGLCDYDRVALSNINRQLYALHSTLGMKKTEVAKRRVLDIQPGCDVRAFDLFLNEETIEDILAEPYDYIIDAIDTVSSKLLLIEQAHRRGIPIVCAMGAGNKINPFALTFADIFETSACPLARVMRRELRKRGIGQQLVLYSTEPPQSNRIPERSPGGVPGSVPFVPPCAGLMLAGHVIVELTRRA